MSQEEQGLTGKLRRQLNQALGPGTLIDKFIACNHQDTPINNDHHYPEEKLEKI